MPSFDRLGNLAYRKNVSKTDFFTVKLERWPKDFAHALNTERQSRPNNLREYLGTLELA